MGAISNPDPSTIEVLTADDLRILSIVLADAVERAEWHDALLDDVRDLERLIALKRRVEDAIEAHHWMQMAGGDDE